MALSEEREKLYQKISDRLMPTPLYQIQNISVPNGCRIFCKMEYLNPTGSHYDRQSLAFLRGLEEDHGASPGVTKIYETTTGSSGASLAWMCRILGYQANILIPEDMPDARQAQIKSYGASIINTPRGEYIKGMVTAYRQQMKRLDRSSVDINPITHSVDTEYSPKSMRAIGEEVSSQMAESRSGKVDCFITALGNGISARGVGDYMLENGVKVVGFEPIESPTITRLFFPDTFEQKFKGRNDVDSPHVIFGTGSGIRTLKEMEKIFPNLTKFAPNIDDIIHPTKEDVETCLRDLHYNELQLVGHSSAAALYSALRYAEKTEKPENILIIFYDAAWRYLPLKSN